MKIEFYNKKIKKKYILKKTITYKKHVKQRSVSKI